MKKALYQRSRFFVIGMITTTLILFSGCDRKQKKQEKETTAIEELKPREDVVEELSGYEIPSSYDITKGIYQAGAPYILSLSNGPEKASEYITQRDKVLNLGIYAADLCYATTYMMKQGTMNYLEA